MKQLIAKYSVFFKNSKFVLLLNISDRVFSFIILLLIAREFTSAEYGEIIALITFAMIMQIIFDFGLPAYLQREIAAGHFDPAQLFSISFVFTLLVLPLYFAVSIAIKLFLYPDSSNILFIIIFAFIYCASLVNICNKALSGKNDFKSQFVSFIISRIYILAMFIAGIYVMGFDLKSLLLVILTGFFLNFVFVFMALDKYDIRLIFRSFRVSELKPVLKAAIPLGLAVIFNFMYDKIDVILISKFKDFEQVAYYNIGYGVYKSASIGFSFLLVTGFTRISSISRDKIAVREFFKEHLKLITGICIVISVLLFVLSEPVINLFYTGRYAGAVTVIKILAFGFTGMGLNNLTGITLNGMGFFKIVMYITLYGLVVNVVLNIFFIPFYGIKAASVVSAVTEYIIFFIQYYYLRKILYP